MRVGNPARRDEDAQGTKSACKAALRLPSIIAFEMGPAMTDLLPELGIHNDACLQLLRFGFLPPGGGADRAAPAAEVPLTSAVGKTLPDVRDTAQIDCRIPMPRVSAENVFVPMVGIRTVLHQVTVGFIRPGRVFLRPHPREFALHIVDKGAFGMVPEYVGRDEHDVPGGTGRWGGGEQAHEPDLPLAADITGRYRAANGVPRAYLAQQDFLGPRRRQCT